MRSTLKGLLFVLLLVNSGWGFFCHQKINRLAVFTLPPEMIGFYKKHLQYISEAATYPDRRRYAVQGEAPRHFIDLDVYGDSACFKLPKKWKEAVEKIGEDSLMEHGIVPWHIAKAFFQLKEAFQLKDPNRILRYSAELGHYVADANVPLHTTENYNGQLTGQRGIHGFWESRVPEMFFERYDFFVGRASYVIDPQEAAWDAVCRAHTMVDSVLRIEKEMSVQTPGKFNYESSGKQTIKVYAASYTREYHHRLSGMVERQLRASIKMTGDLWFTAWVDAGQPDLRRLINYIPSEEELAMNAAELEKWKVENFMARDHEGETFGNP